LFVKFHAITYYMSTNNMSSLCSLWLWRFINKPSWKKMYGGLFFSIFYVIIKLSCFILMLSTTSYSSWLIICFDFSLSFRCCKVGISLLWQAFVPWIQKSCVRSSTELSLPPLNCSLNTDLSRWGKASKIAEQVFTWVGGENL